MFIEGGIESNLADSVVTDLIDKYSIEKNNSVSYNDSIRIQDAWQISESVRAIALDKSLLRILNQLYKRPAKPFQTLNFKKGTQQKAHSDTIHFNSIPGGFMCGIWVALEDIGLEQGPVFYYPKSQTLPEVTFYDVGIEGSYSNYAAYESYLSDLIAIKTLKKKTLTLKKGDVFIWAANLIHGGSFQSNYDLTRYSQVTHYYFDGCQYYSPISSTLENLDYRQPYWVK
jgi:ectoine hydroxylase-related dioxygenase (phytanoyl-CoA dioxygenase family)